MLEDSLIVSRPPARAKKPFTVVLSVITHSIIAVVLVLIPLFQTHVLPQVQPALMLRPPETRAVRLVATDRSPGAVRSKPVQADTLTAPTEIPPRIEIVIDEPVDNGFMPVDGARNSSIGLLDNLLRGPERTAAPPPPPPVKPPSPPPPPPEPAPVVPTGPVRIPGGQVEKSNLVHQVMPVYPQPARATRTEGVVLLEAVITKEGTIDRLRVLSGHMLLQRAAVEAVQQWRYRPTLLNGVPVEVITTIAVSFTLN